MMRRRAMLCVVVAFAIAGCSKDEGTPMTPTPTEKVADTPGNAVLVLQSAFDHKDEQAWEFLFTLDYEFPLDPADTTGRYADSSIIVRDEEIEFARNLFVRGVSGIPLTSPRRDEGSPAAALIRLPPAERITCLLTEPLVATADPRPGRTPVVHRRVRTVMDLSVELPSNQSYSVREAATFYLVRGDSASIDIALLDRGALSDSTRWYIERWESDPGPAVGPAAGSHALPARQFTLGLLKRLYLGELDTPQALRPAPTPRP
jgi:hypothetical protein